MSAAPTIRRQRVTGAASLTRLKKGRHDYDRGGDGVVEGMMAVIYVCDGCGKQAPGLEFPDAITKPRDWFQRHDAEGVWLHACSRDCVAVIAKKTGTTGAILPI